MKPSSLSSVVFLLFALLLSKATGTIRGSTTSSSISRSSVVDDDDYNYYYEEQYEDGANNDLVTQQKVSRRSLQMTGDGIRDGRRNCYYDVETQIPPPCCEDPNVIIEGVCCECTGAGWEDYLNNIDLYTDCQSSSNTNTTTSNNNTYYTNNNATAGATTAGRPRHVGSAFFNQYSNAQGAMLTWAPRVTGSFSLIGSLLILWNILVVRRRRQNNGRQRQQQQGKLETYHYLILGMSTFDICSSIAWIISSSAQTRPNATPNGNYYATSYNDDSAFCTFQGFLFQLGLTSLWYNTSLSFFYLLVIKYGVREYRLSTLAFKYLHVPPLAIGFIFAFCGIPFYEEAAMVCHLSGTYGFRGGGGNGSSSSSGGAGAGGFTNKQKAFASAFLSGIPLLLGAAVVSINMLIIYRHVRKQDLIANRWRMTMTSRLASSRTVSSTRHAGGSTVRYDHYHNRNNNNNNKSTMSNTTPTTSPPAAASSSATPAGATRTSPMTATVFWQSVLYFIAFLTTWSVYFVVVLRQSRDTPFPAWLMFVILTPLQGFWNALVYFRPQIEVAWRKKMKKKKKQKMNTHNKNNQNALNDDDTNGDGGDQKDKQAEKKEGIYYNNNIERQKQQEQHQADAIVFHPSPSPQPGIKDEPWSVLPLKEQELSMKDDSNDDNDHDKDNDINEEKSGSDSNYYYYYGKEEGQEPVQSLQMVDFSLSSCASDATQHA